MLQSSASPRSCTKPDDFQSSDANPHERQNGEGRSVAATQPTRRCLDRCYRTRYFQMVAFLVKSRPQHSKSFREWNNFRPNSQARRQDWTPHGTYGFVSAGGHFDITQSWLQAHSLLHLFSRCIALLQTGSYCISISPAMLQSQLCTIRL